MKTIFILLFFLNLSLSSHSFADKKRSSISSVEQALFVTHADLSWIDSNTLAKPLEKLAQYFLDHKYPTHTLITYESLFQQDSAEEINATDSSEEDYEEFHDNEEPNENSTTMIFNRLGLPAQLSFSLYAESQNGQHDFKPQAKTYIFAGGNFTHCSCTTVISLLNNLSQNKTNSNDLHITFATDALYDGYLAEYQKLMSYTIADTTNDSTLFRLSSIIKKMSNANFMQFLKKHYFTKDNGICPRDPNLKLNKKYSFLISRNGLLLTQIGVGTHKVFLDFKTVDQIIGKQHSKNASFH